MNELRLQTEEDLTGALIKIYDFSGREIMNTRNTNNSLNVSRLTAGVYTVTVIKNGRIISGRFVK